MQGNHGSGLRARPYACNDPDSTMACGSAAKVILESYEDTDFRRISNRGIPLSNMWILGILRQRPVCGAIRWTKRGTMGDAQKHPYHATTGPANSDRPTSAASTT